jgi:hypothetical protein
LDKRHAKAYVQCNNTVRPELVEGRLRDRRAPPFDFAQDERTLSWRIIMATDPIVILSTARTPMGSMQGSLSNASATDLGATAVKAAVERAGVSGADIDRIYMGCVLPAGLGQAPARQAAIKAGLPASVQATTVNKVCGSGMQTVIMGAEALNRRQCRSDRRGRNGIDDQRPIFAQEASRRRAHRP